VLEVIEILHIIIVVGLKKIELLVHVSLALVLKEHETLRSILSVKDEVEECIILKLVIIVQDVVVLGNDLVTWLVQGDLQLSIERVREFLELLTQLV